MRAFCFATTTVARERSDVNGHQQSAVQTPKIKSRVNAPGSFPGIFSARGS